jgi:hypothetical protein
MLNILVIRERERGNDCSSQRYLIPENLARFPKIEADLHMSKIAILWSKTVQKREDGVHHTEKITRMKNGKCLFSKSLIRVITEPKKISSK